MKLFHRVVTPDALDMAEHYRTRAERLADLWVHVAGLALAGVGGVVLRCSRPSMAGSGWRWPPPSTPFAWWPC